MDSDLIHSGLISYMDENFKTAVDQFSKALEKNPDNFEALVYRACSFLKLGNYSSSIDDLNKADKLKENNYEVLYNRAKAYFLSMDFTKGQAELVRLKELSGLSEEQQSNVQSLFSRFS